MDSTMNPNGKTKKGERVGERFLACNISGVEGCAGAPGWGLGRVINGLIIHIDLYKPNNKLVNA
jgi:hypothetical protein